MVIDVFGLLSTNDFDSEIKVGRLGVESKEEAEELIQTLDNMVYKLPKKKQYICEYRWEKVNVD